MDNDDIKARIEAEIAKTQSGQRWSDGAMER